MRFRTCLASLVVVPFLVANNSAQHFAAPAEPSVPCQVTTPNGIAAGPEAPGRSGYGNRDLSVGPFGLWEDGTVVFQPGGAGFVTRDGSLGMKFGWQRAVRGPLSISGRRLDASAQELRSEVSNGRGDPGFVATYLIFPTPGCWEVTGRVAEVSLTFVTKVVKIGDGPPWHRDVP
jgi:hypothetical protein